MPFVLDPQTVAAIAAISATACNEGIKCLVKDLYAVAKSTIKGNAAGVTNRISHRELLKNISQLAQVKTIINPESRQDLSTFYIPTSVQQAGRDKSSPLVTKGISHIGEFNSTRVLIQGTAGQGKSIFLRYLTIRTAASGNTLPLFVELRHLTRKIGLVSLLLSEADTLGVRIDRGAFKALCNAGKITLFLDGFDEVAPSLRRRLLKDIDQLSRKHSALSIFMTARPNSGAMACPHLDAVEMAYLQKQEYRRFVNRYCDGRRQAADLIKGVESSTIESVLDTPLMVALLVVIYRIEQTIPQNEIAFYDDLFMLLLRRHDASKPGFERSRNFKLGDKTLRDIFCITSYLVKRSKVGDPRYTQLCSFAEKALKVRQLDAEATEDAVKDIIDVTNLILRDGEECRYVHRSVMEFHAAECIRMLPDVNAIKFYSSQVGKEVFWAAELGYLRSRDELRFTKYYWIPQLELFQNAASGLLDTVKTQLALKRFIDLMNTDVLPPCTIEFTEKGTDRLLFFTNLGKSSGGFQRVHASQAITYDEFRASKLHSNSWYTSNMAILDSGLGRQFVAMILREVVKEAKRAKKFVVNAEAAAIHELDL